MGKNRDHDDQFEDKKSKEPVTPPPIYEKAFGVPSNPTDVDAGPDVVKEPVE